MDPKNCGACGHDCTTENCENGVCKCSETATSHSEEAMCPGCGKPMSQCTCAAEEMPA